MARKEGFAALGHASSAGVWWVAREPQERAPVARSDATMGWPLTRRAMVERALESKR